ncbi:MAG: histidinol-phosphatase HisJ family protein [Eubacterium sp.]|nr:histidinol-phosphatase HisJ family protein [Eubacterium sp.]
MNMYPDYHLHTGFSADCRTHIRDQIEAARRNGLKEICITDHYDHDFPKDAAEVDFRLDFDRYFDTLVRLREELVPDLTLKIGIEQGLMPSTCKVLSDFSKRYPQLDFIICSSHVVDGFDPYYPPYFEKWGEKGGYRRYFEEILYIVRHFQDYSVYGHLDYILRYGPTKAEHFDVKDYMEIFEAIFRQIIDNGKGIEINTGSLYRGMDFAHPHPDLLRLFKEMGGEIITFGSDSHDRIHAGYRFDEAGELLRSLGFKYYCTFSRLKPEFHPL